MTQTPSTSEDRFILVSSDGHASAEMTTYRDYLPSSWHDEFDAFCERWAAEGSRNWDRPALEWRLDPDVVDEWEAIVLKPERYRGIYDSQFRFAEMERQGIAAEVIFPDFGIPFELYPPSFGKHKGYHRTPEQVQVGHAAYNRWLVDFCDVAPERFAGMALVNFDDPTAAIDAIRWAKSAGLRGVVLPSFSEEHPVFDPIYDPVWATLVELEMPVNSHPGISSAIEYAPRLPPHAHTATAIQVLMSGTIFFCQQLLSQMIWGGVLERFPGLQVVFTEQGTGWVVGELAKLDHTWHNSYLRRDIRDIVPRPPSEYFARQCHMGSSLFSEAEADARHLIGVDKITVGMDYPHHEGTWAWGVGHADYLRATLGSARVPEHEARLMVGENAISLWHFDRRELERVAEKIGPSAAEILTPPERDLYPRGDVHKPLSISFGGT